MTHHVEVLLLVILAFVIVYSLLTRWLDKTILTLPILFVALGYALSGPISSLAPQEELRSMTRYLAEITLVLVLFSDAGRIRFAYLKHNFQLPLRMLLIAMPLTIIFGAVYVNVVSPDSGLMLSVLTAAILTPTDAALSQSVVSNPSVPDRLSETINVESGLNDGLALPFVLIAAALTSGAVVDNLDGFSIVWSGLAEFAIAAFIGVVFGLTIARVLDFAIERDMIIESAKAIVFLAAAFATYLASNLLGGNGFVSTFIAGVVFGNTFRHDVHFISEFMEGTGGLLTMMSFMVFGAIMLPGAITHISSISISVALGFITFIRLVPILLSLTGTSLNIKEKLFLGWFGPRGLASILFTLIVMDEFDFPNEAELLYCVSLTVLLSVIVHGVTSVPLANYIGRNASPKE